jgi:hypothetical protein
MEMKGKEEHMKKKMNKDEIEKKSSNESSMNPSK